MIHIPPTTFPAPEQQAEPFRIEPIFKERIWGSRSLAPLFPEKSNLREPIGEAWLTAVECRVANGGFIGRTLGEAWKEMPASWRGAQFAEPTEFPLLAKFIFPADKLSIQVHPDDAYAAVHEKAAGGRGKTEMWHVVSAEPGAWLLAGLKGGVTKEKFRAALHDHTLEELFQSHKVSAGDTFFIPAGMPHTIGPGMILCEVQEYSDLTYRVYDYGRTDAKGKPRQLHIDKALEVMKFASDAGGRVVPGSSIKGKKGLHHLVDCAYFSVDRCDFDQKVHEKGTSPASDNAGFSLMVVIAGNGAVSWLSGDGKGDGGFEFRQGECWFIPANAFVSHSFYPKGKVSLLWASVPVTQTERAN